MKPLRVEQGPVGPRRFFWRGRWLCVTRLLDVWDYEPPWWEDPGETRHFFRLETNAGLYEIYREGDGWWLFKIFD